MEQDLSERHGAAFAIHPAELAEITRARAGPTFPNRTKLMCPTSASMDLKQLLRICYNQKVKKTGKNPQTL